MVTATRYEITPDEGELPWGRHYVMCPPKFFTVRYAINPFMHPTEPVDSDRAYSQWERLVAVMRAAGARVDTITPEPSLPDMVYAMNWALVDGHTVVLSQFRYPQRQGEAAAAGTWFTNSGYIVRRIGQATIGSFEGGDVFPVGNALLAGHGFRTQPAMRRALADLLEVRVASIRLTDERFYHLDLSFCPLDDRHAIIAPFAWDAAGRRTVAALVPEPLALELDEALRFCANGIVIGRRVILPACPPRLARQLAAWRFEVEVVDVSELQKGGGSIRCMTLALDTTFDTARRNGDLVNGFA